MEKLSVLALVCAATAVLPAAAQVEIEWVTVGNPGNPADPLTTLGDVDYEYRIGATEVTNEQYAEFLNAVAASDPNQLYNPSMGSDPRGGIARSGADGSYTYAVRPNMGDKPVNFAGWFDAIRFCNWLTNGQGSGDTESGAYTLGSNPFRAPSAAGAVFLPNEEEWYKAAYYQPSSMGGDADNYWLYATQSNAETTPATATAIGDVANPGAGVTNRSRFASWDDQFGHVTTVASAGNTSPSGAFDMNGNVSEWVETTIDTARFLKGTRGGSWRLGSVNQRSTTREGLVIDRETEDVGFRVASLVPATDPCPADIADDFGFAGPDGQVGFGDFLFALTVLGPCPGGPPPPPGCDFDIADDFGFEGADGQVSFGDFLFALTILGPCP